MTRRRPAVVAAALLSLAMASPLLAAWNTTGSGASAATASALGRPTALSATDVTETGMTLSWSAPSTGPAPDAYVVRRNGAAITTCQRVTPTSCRDSGLTASTSYTYTVEAALGTWRGTASDSVTQSTAAPAPVDSPPSVSAITLLGSSPTAASTVSWGVTFSEAVTGVDPTDFALASTVAGAALTGVTGGGSSWTVTASTGTGSGSLGLNLVDDDTIRAGAGLWLGGEGAGNGNRTGPTYTIDRTVVPAPTAPTVTINQRAGQADPTDSVPLQWTVAFSAPVTGFDATDLVRSGTSQRGTVAVSGSGASYEVSLSGGATAGTVVLSVPAGAAVDAAGAASSASTSTDNSITLRAVVVSAKGEPSVQHNREFFTGTTTKPSGTVTITVTGGDLAAGAKTFTATPSTTASNGVYGWRTPDTQPQDLKAGQTYDFEAVHRDALGNISAALIGTVSGR